MDGRQHPADVGLVPHRVELLRHVGGTRPACDSSEGGDIALCRPRAFHGLCVQLHEAACECLRAPVARDLLLTLDIRGVDAPWEIRPRRGARYRPRPHQRSDPFGVHGGQQCHARSPFQETADDRLLHASGVHHGERVRNPGLEVRRPTVTARTTGAAPVVQDHPRGSSEVLVDGAVNRRVPPLVDDREEVVLPQEVDRSIAEGLVREVCPILSAGEGDTGALHARMVQSTLPGRNLGKLRDAHDRRPRGGPATDGTGARSDRGAVRDPPSLESWHPPSAGRASWPVTSSGASPSSRSSIGSWTRSRPGRAPWSCRVIPASGRPPCGRRGWRVLSFGVTARSHAVRSRPRHVCPTRPSVTSSSPSSRRHSPPCRSHSARPSRWPSCAHRDRAPEPTSGPCSWPCLDASDRWPPPLRSWWPSMTSNGWTSLRSGCSSSSCGA